MRLRVITHTFPPSTHANAKRPHYLVKGFLEAGWEVDVFTHWTGVSPGSPETVTHPALRIFRQSDPVEVLLRRTRAVPVLSRLVALSLAGVMWPDVYSLWARRLFRGFQARGPYDRTLAFILPGSVLLSGRYPGLVDERWTFDYQEPISPQQQRMTRRSPLQKRLQSSLTALERETLHRAGRVVFTANANRKAYVAAGLVQEDATAHVPYFYDADSFAVPAESVDAGFSVVYFGTFDCRGARSPEIFLKALAKFLQQRPEARTRARFTFYGNWLGAHHDRWVDEFGLREVVSFHPPVDYAEYLQKLRQCPVLLLVVSSVHDLFMPSKVVDYFGARRPIMALVPRDSEMRQVLERAGMSEFACDESDVEGGVAVLERLWTSYRAGTLVGSREKTGFWSSETQIPRYLELVKRRERPLTLAEGVSG